MNRLKYKSEFCDLLIKHMEKGFSFDSFGGVIDVTRETMYQWVKNYPEWAEAKELGFQKCRVFWEDLGIKGISGRKKGFNVVGWIFNMKNRFREDWADVQKIEGGDKPFTLNYKLEDK